MAELCRHLEETHHAFYQRELPRLAKLSSKVAAAYIHSHPETTELDGRSSDSKPALNRTSGGNKGNFFQPSGG